jgi:hypothetical protein
MTRVIIGLKQVETEYNEPTYSPLNEIIKFDELLQSLLSPSYTTDVITFLENHYKWTDEGLKDFTRIDKAVILLDMLSERLHDMICFELGTETATYSFCRNIVNGIVLDVDYNTQPGHAPSKVTFLQKNSYEYSY